MMHALWAVFRKEWVDSLRDRRSVATALLLPVLGPFLFWGLATLMIHWLQQEKPLELAVVGAEHAPTLVAFLEQREARIVPAPPDYAERIRRQELEVALVIPKDYGESLEKGEPAKLRLVFDESRNSALASIRKTRLLLADFGRQLATLRLLARGVSPYLAAPVAVEEEDLATPQQRAVMLLAMIPMFLMLSALVSGMHLAIDSTAGERERASLEPLLLNPVRLGLLVTGKWLATVAFTLAVLPLSLVGFALVAQRVPLASIGLTLRFDAAQAVLLFALLVPLAMASSAVQLLFSTFARSFKEAQAFATAFAMVVMAPSAAVSMMQAQTAHWMTAVPGLSQQVLIAEVLRGEVLKPAWLLLSSGTSLAVTVLCLFALARLFRSERVVFGR